MSIETTLHGSALVHRRLLLTFIAATEHEHAAATADHVRDSLEETLERLYCELADYHQMLSAHRVPEAA